MTYIGEFGETDPYYRQRQLQQAGEAVGSAFQLAMAQREKKARQAKDERDREIQRMLMLAQDFPEAARSLGASLVQKYGEEMPYLGEIVSSLEDQSNQRKTGQAAGQRWLEGVERREQPLRKIVANPGDWRAPLLTPSMAADRIPQVPSAVAGELPFAEREAARVWAGQQGYSFPPAPTTFDPYTHLEQGQKALHAQRTGAWNVPGASEAAEIGVGLKPSAGAELSAEVQREQGVRADARLALDERQFTLATRKQTHEEIREARIARQEAAGEGGEAAKPAAIIKDVAGWIADDMELLAEEWDVGLEEAANAKESKVTPAIRNAYAAKAGPRPQPILKSQANLIARKVAEAITARGETVTPSRVQGEVDVIMEAYRTLVARGKTREQAMRVLLGGGR